MERITRYKPPTLKHESALHCLVVKEEVPCWGGYSVILVLFPYLWEASGISHWWRQDINLAETWISIWNSFYIYTWYCNIVNISSSLLFPVIYSDAFRYLSNFQHSIPSFQCALELIQVLIIIAEKPLASWKRDKIGNIYLLPDMHLPDKIRLSPCCCSQTLEKIFLALFCLPKIKVHIIFQVVLHVKNRVNWYNP